MIKDRKMGTCRSLPRLTGCEGAGDAVWKQVCSGCSSPCVRAVMLCSWITQNLALSFSCCSQITLDLRSGLACGIQTVPGRNSGFSFLPDHRARQGDFLRCLLHFGSQWTEVESSQWIRMRIQAGTLGTAILCFFYKWQHGWENAAATFVVVFVLI